VFWNRFWLVPIFFVIHIIITGCSTVLLPAKVVQALNLNLEGMGAQAQFGPRYNGSFATYSGKYIYFSFSIGY
jgi:hypothetical protein